VGIQVKDIGHRHLYYFFLHTFIFSLLFSKAGISISITALLFLSLFRVKSLTPLRITTNTEFFKLKNYIEKDNQIFLTLTGLFILTLLSYINSENTVEWFHFVKLTSPYIAIPIIFINHPKLPKEICYSLCFTLVLLVSLCTIYVMTKYFLNAELINDSISQGKSLETPLTHVKFSVLIAFSIIMSVILLISKTSVWGLINKYSLIGIFIFLFISIHILSVRSGLLVLYGSILILLSILLIKHKKYFVLGLSLIGIFIIPLIAYKTIPSFYNKYHYTMHDIQMIKEGKASNYSDGERLRSIKIGLDIWKENIWTGIGIGDIRDRCNTLYEQWYPDSIKKILPHSQYILSGAANGIFGFTILLICILTPLLYSHVRMNPVFLLTFILILLYGLVEKPLYEYIFINFHCFFFSLTFKR